MVKNTTNGKPATFNVKVTISSTFANVNPLDAATSVATFFASEMEIPGDFTLAADFPFIFCSIVTFSWRLENPFVVKPMK